MVDKTMMGDKCAELVRAAMIGALAVTLGNPTAVYAAEEETADPGQIGIEIAGEAAVGAASFCVEEDAAEAQAAEVSVEQNAEENGDASGTEEAGNDSAAEPESPQDDGTEETDSEKPQGPDLGESADVEKPGADADEVQKPESGEDTGVTKPGEPDSVDSEVPDSGNHGEISEMPDSGDHTDMPETPGSEGDTDTSEKPGNSETDDPWPGEGEDVSNDPWPGQEETEGRKEENGDGDGTQLEPPEEENGSEGSVDESTGGSASANREDKTAEASSNSASSPSVEPPAAGAEPVFSAEQEAARHLVGRGPQPVAGALEAEHRVEDVDRDHRLAVGGVRGAGGGERCAGVSGDDGTAAAAGAGADGGGTDGRVARVFASGGLLAGVLRRGIPAGNGRKRGADERIPAAGRGSAGGDRCGGRGMDAGIFPVSGAAAGEAGGRRPRRLPAGMRWGCGLLRGGTAGGAG